MWESIPAKENAKIVKQMKLYFVIDLSYSFSKKKKEEIIVQFIVKQWKWFIKTRDLEIEVLEKRMIMKMS